MRILFFISLFISMSFSAQSKDSQFFTAKSEYDFKQTVGRLKKNFKANIARKSFANYGFGGRKS